MRLRMLAFIVFVLGMFLLFVLVNLPASEISGVGEIGELELNSRVVISGEVVSERLIYEGTKVLQVNGLEVIVESTEDFKGESVKIIGSLSDYEGERQVVAERILFE